jgi:hypothetical protein
MAQRPVDIQGVITRSPQTEGRDEGCRGQSDYPQESKADPFPLQQVAVASVAPVEAHRVAGEQSSHHRSEGNFTGTKKKGRMVRQKRPGIAGGFRL